MHDRTLPVWYQKIPLRHLNETVMSYIEGFSSSLQHEAVTLRFSLERLRQFIQVELSSSRNLSPF